MPVEIATSRDDTALPVHLVSPDGFAGLNLDSHARNWAAACGYEAAPGSLLILPDGDGAVRGAILGIAEGEAADPLAVGVLARKLPEGRWRFAETPDEPELAALALLLGGYAFTRYGRKPTHALVFEAPDGIDVERVRREAEGVFLARDLINTPANDMGPDRLEKAVRELASRHGAEVSVTAGDDLLAANFPMIHAVGRAAEQAPRLIDMHWGRSDAPRVTLVGKGVCFDSGGLSIKPAGGMVLMKKDMGGAANVLGLAAIIMSAGLDLRLRVLVPAVENAIAGNAFRPGDVLTSRAGKTVEIGNTDAEGRLVLADALALADEEAPRLLVDMATLTGAARVALGPDLPPFYTDDEALAGELRDAALSQADPLWRMPLWRPYHARLSSKVADFSNVASDGFAGSVTAALFLRRFVRKAESWTHLDIYGWNPHEKPHAPVGGEAQGVRALSALLGQWYG